MVAYIGYTHYWRKNRAEHDIAKFAVFVEDVKKVVEEVKKQGIVIAGGDGGGGPELTKDLTMFRKKSPSFRWGMNCGNLSS